MYTLELTKSIGRTGNCMICLIGAIEYSLKNNINKIIFNQMLWQSNNLLPGHGTSKVEDKLLKTLEINLDTVYNQDLSFDTIKKRKGGVNWNNDKNRFESWFSAFYNGKIDFNQRKDIVQKYIEPIFNYNKNISINDNDLVIHLRSGDIMNQKHYAYIQPPLSFYIEVIESKNWNKIYIITEKINNPCLSKLKDKYTNVITFIDNKKKRDGGNGFGFKEDLSYLIASKNYVPCQSSLCPLIIQLSKTIKNVYIPSYMLKTEGHHAIREHKTWWSKTLTEFNNDFIYHNIHFHVLDYDEYINTPDKIFDYTNPKNKDYMLQYTK